MGQRQRDHLHRVGGGELRVLVAGVPDGQAGAAGHGLGEGEGVVREMVEDAWSIGDRDGQGRDNFL